MVHIVIDSNALRHDLRLEKRGFGVLNRAARFDLCRVHVPAVVRSEVLEYVRSQHRDLSGALKNAPRYSLEDDEHEVFDRASELAKHSVQVGPERWESRLDAWLAETGGTVLEVGPDHGQRVLAAYFAGTPPFKGVDRSVDKDHFPDAFIYEAVRDLVGVLESDVDVVRVLTNDKQLGRACSELSGVETYSYVEPLLQEEKIVEQLTTVMARKAAIPALRQYLSEDPPEVFLERLEEAARHGVYGAIGSGLTVNGTDTEVEDIDAVQYPEFEFRKMEEYAPGLLSLPFAGPYEATVTYDVDLMGSYDDPDAPPEPEAPGREWFATGSGMPGVSVERGATLDLRVEGTLTLELPEGDDYPQPDGSGFYTAEGLEWVGVRFESLDTFQVQ